jgi:chromatin remodeling complex protein RSC6
MSPVAKKTNNALQAPVKPSPELSQVLGSSDPISRPEVMKKVWEYIKKNNLQNPENKREINADESLKKVFGKPRLDMFEMTKAINKHLSK